MAFSNSLSFKSKVYLITILNIVSISVLLCLTFISNTPWLSAFLIFYVLFVGALSISIFSSLDSTFQFFKNILTLSKSLSEGKIEKIKIEHTNEEDLKELALSTLEIKQTYLDIINLANQIGNKNFDFEYKPKSVEDELGKNLVSMKDSLREIAEKDAQQNWITAGLAKFGDLLRVDNETIDVLSLNVISGLCKYIDANQGGLFVLNEEKQGEEVLELRAFYAYNKQKFINKIIALEKVKNEYIYGEGLVGQSFIEKDSIYITSVPENFVNITSGLGEALPRNIFIVPLKYNDQMVGVIELASFNFFKEHERVFIEKLAEQIAATIVTANINERTKKLLSESQRQSNELRRKEEEMKQNYEELSAIQEELSRNELELLQLKENLEEEVRNQTRELEAQKVEILNEQYRAQQKEKMVMAVLNGTEAAIFLTSENGNIIIANEATAMMTGIALNDLIGIDFHHFLLIEKIRMGRPFRSTLQVKSGGEMACEIVVNKIGVDGETANLFYIVDISSILKSEAKLQNKIKELEDELAKLKNI